VRRRRSTNCCKAADYIVQRRQRDVVLCERGVRSFDPSTRYLLDLAAVPVLLQRTDQLPIVVDPSHGTGVAISWRRWRRPRLRRAPTA
jgi:3-deoxy-D-arabino-heptulosonate 7-phosphate (DAHP) synthase